MGKRHFYKVLSFIIAIVCFTTALSNPLTVNADSAATFHNGMLVLTPEGMNGTRPDFFKEYTSNLVPGDNTKFAIKLKNDSSEKVKFYFWASDTDFANNERAKLISDDLLSKINIKIELKDSNTIIYGGPANGKGSGLLDSSNIIGTGSEDAISLGWLDANTSTIMDITISVPTTLGNEYQGAVGAVDWMFLCEIYEVPTTEVTPPIEPTTPPIEPTMPPTEPTTPPTEPSTPPTEPVNPTEEVTPTVTPVITEPSIGISPTPGDDTFLDITDDDIPLNLEEGGSVNVEEDDTVNIEEDSTPSGVIVVDDSDLGKLPQTGTFASVIGNSKNIGWFVLLILSGCFTLSLIKNKRKNTSN